MRQMGRGRQSVCKALKTKSKAGRLWAHVPNALPRSPTAGLWGQWCPSAQVPPMPGASTALGGLALIRGPANGSEDWPVPGTLLNRDLGEIYS